ncbi:glycosyltransferase family 39 protein [Patescibacteria group bacterium]|nr:glycosyltransferase family 39 protein [Patescibacteria group bacterium]MBU1931216.1 glycosyltransferase family 39 protein [Patescibacteria group bacterium]
MKINKKTWPILIVLILAAILRLFKLTQVPPGFWFDESSFAYSAYSILKTGRDEFGQALPLLFQSFGQYNAPLFFYYLVPFMAIFGLNIWAVRLASAVLGVVTVYGIFLLGRELINRRVGLLAAFVFAISPFALQFNRMMHENNLLAVLIVFGIYFLLKGFKKPKYLFLTALLFSLTFYTYLAARIFTPLFLIFVYWLFRDRIKLANKRFLQPLIVALLLLLPFIWSLKEQEAWQRTGGTSIFGDVGIILRINEQRGKYGIDSFLGRALHNKLIGYTQAFLSNYLSHWTPDFWLFNGDPVKIYKTPNIGLILFWELPFFIIGISQLFKSKKGRLVFGWLSLAFVPAALTRFVPSASRSFMAAPAIALVSGLGLNQAWDKLNKKKFLLVIFYLLLGTNLIYYAYQYYFNLNQHYSYQWRKGIQETIGAIAKVEQLYPKIVVDQESINYISVLFFLKYPPAEVQQEAKLINRDEFGFSYIPKIGRYYFTRNMPQDLESGVLYAGLCQDLEKDAELIEKIPINETQSFCLVAAQS